jgi:hypothetical protein
MRIEVIDLIFEFLVSILVIAGGGFLMFIGKGDSTFITAMMALVIGFWFQSRSNATTVRNLLQPPPQTGTLPIAINGHQVTTTTTETTNPTNPPVIPPGNTL